MEIIQSSPVDSIACTKAKSYSMAGVGSSQLPHLILRWYGNLRGKILVLEWNGDRTSQSTQ